MKNWYVIRSKPQKEDALYREMLARNLDAYLPILKVKPVNPRSRKTRAYIPGYLFVYADLEEVGFSALQWIPHSLGLIQFGGDPATVPESLINAMRKRVDEINKAGGEARFSIQRGDKVRILSGPFEGYEAVFDSRLQGADRARVFLAMLERQVPLEVASSGLQVASGKYTKNGYNFSL